MIERKTIPLIKASVDAETGEFSGYANVFDVIDHGGDRVLRGAFEKALPVFLKEGFIAWGHDWMLPVAMPVEAKEDDTGLLIRARFHSTEAAQEKRTITAERLDAGLTMGLSIGYMVESDRRASDGARELVTINPLFETSLVMVPMNGLSNVTAVKGGGLGSGLPYAEHLDWVLGEVEAILGRSVDRAAAREKEGRVLSATNRDRLDRLAGAMREVLAELDGLLADTDPEKSARLAAEWAALQVRARGLGVPS